MYSSVIIRAGSGLPRRSRFELRKPKFSIKATPAEPSNVQVAITRDDSNSSLQRRQRRQKTGAGSADESLSAQAKPFSA